MQSIREQRRDQTDPKLIKQTPRSPDQPGPGQRKLQRRTAAAKVERFRYDPIQESFATSRMQKFKSKLLESNSLAIATVFRPQESIIKDGRTTLKISDPVTGFRLPRTMLAQVDSDCAQQDLTRSQVFRRSLMEYLRNQNAVGADVNPTEPRGAWPAELFEGPRRMY
jgi:hypothetical protein